MKKLEFNQMVLTGPRQFGMRKTALSLPDGPGPGQVLIKVEAVGVCGSDIHFFSAADEALPYPIGLGHECVGRVAAVGRGVTQVKPGQRVVLEPGRECGACEYCQEGRYNLCDKMDFLAAPPDFKGGLQEYLLHPENRCFVLPEHVSAANGALAEPMAVGFYAAQKGTVDKGQTVLIVGAGCIGLMSLLGCLRWDAKRVIVADLCQNRLDMAAALGASQTLNTTGLSGAEALRQAVAQLKADVVIECSASQAALDMAGSAVRPGGKIVLVGCVVGDARFDFSVTTVKEAEILSVYRYRHIFLEVVRAIAQGQTGADRMISGVYPFEKTQRAFEDAANHKDTVIKNVIMLGGDSA